MMSRRAPRVSKQRPLDRYPRGKCLWVSEVAEQVYCEQRVDLWLGNPGRRVSVPKQLEGTADVERHEGLSAEGTAFHRTMSAGATRITERQLQRLLKAGASLTVLEMPLQHTYRGVAIVGQADGVCFEGSNATCAIDYKYTESTRLFESWRLQLVLYGYLLSRAFGVEDLVLVCAKVTSSVAAEQRTEGAAKAISDSARSVLGRDASANGVSFRHSPSGLAAHVHAFRYDANEATRQLDHCLQYWLGERGPRPAGNSNRCVQCRYNALNLCPAPQAPFGVRS